MLRAACRLLALLSAVSLSLAVVRAQEPLTPEYRSGQINGYRVSLSFNENLDPSIVPPPHAFEISGYASTVRRVSINGAEVRLTVVPPIPEGADAVLIYTAPATGGIEALRQAVEPGRVVLDRPADRSATTRTGRS